MILKNAQLVNHEFKLINADLRIENEIIAEVGSNLKGDNVVDLQGCYLLPGFIDTHIHGAYGVRISDRDVDLSPMTKFEATQGVTAIAITTAASEFSGLLNQLKASRVASSSRNGSKVVAVHAEGPFISHKYKGAMTEKYILTPDIAKFDAMLEASEGLLKILTIAPEIEGAMELIDYATKNGIVVSMGHTDADYDTAQRAISVGASRMTHTFNAARPINHREPGVLSAALLSENVTCEMICDYVHLHPATIEMIFRMKGADKICMISDSGHAAGLDVTEFEADGVMRYVKDGVVRLANGTIAGSAMTLYDGVKNLIKSGFDIADVSKMASFNPAKSLGIDNVTGSIAQGKLADLVVLDKKLDIVDVFINGKRV